MEINMKNLPDTVEIIDSPTGTTIFRIKESQLVFSLSDVKFIDEEDDLKLGFEYIILRNPNDIQDDIKLKDQLGDIIIEILKLSTKP